MSFIEVISTTNSIKANFGDYFLVHDVLNISDGTWRKEGISFQKMANCVEVNVAGEKTWYLSFDAYQDAEIKTLKVDKVNEVVITSNTVLFDELSKTIE